MLTKAASNSSQLGHPGCSIVVHEGMYINPTSCYGYGVPFMFALPWPKGFSLEIVGLQEVRILSTSAPLQCIFAALRMELIIRNVTIYGRRGPLNATITACAASVQLVDVRIHGSRHHALQMTEGSNLKAVNCAFAEFRVPFSLTECKAVFKSCRWTFRDGCAGDLAAFTGSTFHGDMRFGIVHNGSATFHQCQFIRSSASDEETGGFFVSNYGAIYLAKQGKLLMTESSVSGFERPVIASDSYSNAVIKRCQFLDCGTAFSSDLNSDISVIECELAVKHLLKLSLNEKGKVRFERNTLRPTRKFPELFLCPNWPNQPIIVTDREAKVLTHDFAKVNIEYIEPRSQYHPKETYGPTRQSRIDNEEYAVKMKLNVNHLLEGVPSIISDLYVGKDMRECLHCGKTSKEKPKAKFQYCAKCRNVSYCSKECQAAHWRDHKLLCKTV